MSRYGRPDSNLRRLRVTDFSDHDDIRVLTEDGTQAIGEGQPRLDVDLNLIDPCQLVFDWVFNGDDVDLRLVDFFK